MSSPVPKHSKVSMAHMQQLDGLRAICLLSIVVHHWTMRHITVEFPFEIGAFVFFSLSGYLITRILLRGKTKISTGQSSFPHFMKSFTMRRVLRLLPAYFLALLLYLLLWSPDVVENFLWYLTNCSNIHFAIKGAWPGGADQFWTLAVDQQFYAFWPFLVLLLPSRFIPVAFLLIAALSPFSRFMTYFDHPLFDGPMHDKLPWFLTDHLCFGALLAYLQEKGRMPKKLFLWIGLVISLLVYLPMRYHWLGIEAADKILIYQQTVLAFFSTCLVGLCALGMGGVGKFLLENKVTQYLGKRSYGYYLYHNLAFLILGKIGFFLFPTEGEPDHLYPVRLVAAALILYWMAHFSWKFLEEPIMRRKEKHRYQPAPSSK